MSPLYSSNSLEISGNPKSCIEKLWSDNVFLINFNAFLSDVISCIFGFIKYNLYLSYNSHAFIGLWKINTGYMAQQTIVCNFLSWKYNFYLHSYRANLNFDIHKDHGSDVV